MKESEIHNGLPDKEIRILIAHDLRETSHMEMENKQVSPGHNENIFDYVIEDSKNAIKFHQQRIKISELRKGLLMIITKHGWEEHDISNENIQIELGEKYYLSFIGTEAEHKALLKKLYKK